jgi:hypothetical protein
MSPWLAQCPDCGEMRVATISEVWGKTYPLPNGLCFICGYSRHGNALSECKRKKKQISSCTCDIKVLMVTGCRCGAFLRERERENAMS